MTYNYLGGVLEITNVFISLFVLAYAWSFLRQTADVKDRKPWVYLFFAAVMFFFFEVAGVIDILSISSVPGLRSFLESAFIALILFVFIFQYDLILKSDLILITRKIAREERIEENEDFIAEKLNIPVVKKSVKKRVKPATKKRLSKNPAKKKLAKKKVVKKKIVKKATKKKR